jgi:hypothetical protein
MDKLGPNQTFRSVEGQPIFWRDKKDFVHACAAAMAVMRSVPITIHATVRRSAAIGNRAGCATRPVTLLPSCIRSC